MGRHAGQVPATALGFWVIGIFAAVLVVAAAARIAAGHFHPTLRWAVVATATTAGTTLADLFGRSLGTGSVGGSSILLRLVVSTVALWYRSLGPVSADRVASPTVEAFS